MKLLKIGSVTVFLSAALMAAGGDFRLIEAAKSGNAKTVRALLEQHVPVSAVEADGSTALHAAVRFDSLEIADLLQKIYPQNFDASKTIVLLGNSDTVQKLKDGTSAADIVASWQSSLADYDKTRRHYLLYK